jgi:hypothetical protein
MSLPINLLKSAGFWDIARTYYEYDCVVSTIDNNSYCCVIDRIIGGPDPSVQPSAVWIPFPVASKGFPPVYGSFSSTQTTTLIANKDTPLVYDTKDIASTDVNVLFPDSKITFNTTGVYKILTSIQCDSTSGIQTLTAYLSLGGNPVPNTASQVIVNINTQTLLTVEWFLQIDAGKYIEVVLYDKVGGGQAVAFPAVVGPPAIPATPSVITTILRIA